MKAFVLIVVNRPSEAPLVVADLRALAIPGISESYVTMGPYDIIAVLDVPGLSDAPSIVTQIRKINRIESTTICAEFPEMESSPIV